MTDDPLDGFRGSRHAVARQIEHADPNNELWGRLYLGDAANKIMRGVATRTDIVKVMAMMIAHCELDTQTACKALLECDDPASPEARKAHFDARVSGAILGRLNEYIHDGEAAGEALNTAQDT